MTTTNYETEAELYANARDAAVEAWRTSHRQAFALMMEGVMADYHAEIGGFARRHAYCIRLAAEAAGFPCLSQWLNQRYPRKDAA